MPQPGQAAAASIAPQVAQKFPLAALPQRGQVEGVKPSPVTGRHAGSHRAPHIAEYSPPRDALRWRLPPAHATLFQSSFRVPMTTPSSDTIDLSNADHMGDLARGGTTWSVHLETRQDDPVTGGRVHFVAGDVRRSSAWIFREWSAQEVRARFVEFSPLELWRLLESLS